MADDIPECIDILSRNLVNVLNEAWSAGAAIVPDVDPDGISYSIEWVSGGKPADLDIEWIPELRRWVIVDGR